jgi:3-oxoacyl-[acyl-carrier protein] reductase
MTKTNKLDFTGKIVLVVGGTSGIGNGIACAFREHGAEVHVWGTRKMASDYRDDASSNLTGLRFSQVNIASKNAIDSYRAPFDALDVLVLSQGDSFMADGASEYEWDKCTKVLNINVTSVLACCVKFKPMLAASRGAIVVLSSMASAMALPDAPAYCASKHAITGLCRSLALGWAGDSIRVNAIGPGVVPSRMARAITDSPQYTAMVVSRNPMKRLGTREEIADAALFLGSPMASYVTGQTLLVDGGHTLVDTG